MASEVDRFVKLPVLILRRRDLTAGAKVVYAAIIDRLGTNETAWPGVRTIATDTGMTVPAVIRAVACLRYAGVLLVESAGSGRRQSYRPVPLADLPPEAGKRSRYVSAHDSLPLTKRDRKRSRNVSGGANESCAEALTKRALNQTDSLTRPINQTQKAPLARFDPLAIALPESINTPAFREAWANWCKHRMEIKRPLTKTATDGQIAKFAAMGHDRALAAVQHSTANGWQGVFEPREDRSGNRITKASGTNGRPTSSITANARYAGLVGGG